MNVYEGLVSREGSSGEKSGTNLVIGSLAFLVDGRGD